MRILVMDDEECVRSVVCRMLGALGHDVTLTCNGQEATAAYAEALREGRPFAAVLLDMHVPGGMGGEASLAELKAIDPGVRAIASTGDWVADPDGTTQGFAAVLVKPYSRDDLAAAVERVVGGA